MYSKLLVLIVLISYGVCFATDSDNDGMPNDWEVTYSLDPNNAADADTDLDSDNYNNVSEYLHGTEPNNVASVPTANITILIPSQLNKIQRGINASINGDMIVVSQGIYYEKINYNGKKILLKSTDPNDPNIVAHTIIDANNTASPNYVVTFNTAEDGNSVLDGFVIQRGYQGIYCGLNAAIRPQIKNCIIRNNGNYGVNYNTASPQLYRCQILKNKSWGIYTSSSGSATIKNCVIAKNTGYGIYTNNNYQITVLNCTIYGNSQCGIGSTHATIKNCILWNNVDDLANCTATFSCIKNMDEGTGNLHSEPLFVNADANDFHLQYASQCVDAGDPNSAHDLEPNGGGIAIDIGAYGNTTDAPNCYDGDNDGLADEWEIEHFGDNTVDPNDDADGDGLRNKDEYHIAWDPNESNAATIKGFVTNHQLGFKYPSIQKSIDFANNGQTLIAEPNHFYEQINFNGKPITLRSIDPNDSNSVSQTIIDGNSAAYSVYFNTKEGSGSVIEGLTIRKGSTAVLYCVDSSPTIRKSVMKEGYRGAYIKCSSSSSLLSATPYFENCVFSNNTNYGVFASSYSAPYLYGCKFLANVQSGAYCGSNKPMIIRNCVAKGNGRANYNDGGIYVGSAGHVSVINCTVVNNLKCGIVASNSSVDLKIKNSIIWHTNTCDDLINCAATYSCIKDNDAGLGNIHPAIGPNFVDINNDYHLQENSICIDAGEPWADYSNEPSPNGGRIDLGAYGNTSEATSAIDDNNDGITDSWQAYHWSNYDPNDPNFGPDGDYDNDGYTNQSEYLYGYDPNTVTTVPFEIIYVQSAPYDFNPAIGENVSLQYWVNKTCNATVDITNTVVPKCSSRSKCYHMGWQR